MVQWQCQVISSCASPWWSCRQDAGWTFVIQNQTRRSTVQPVMAHRYSVSMNHKLVSVFQERVVQSLQHGWQAGLFVQCKLELPIDVGLNCGTCTAW